MSFTTPTARATTIEKRHREGHQGHADSEERAQNPDRRTEDTGHEADCQTEQTAARPNTSPKSTPPARPNSPSAQPEERVAHEQDQPQHDEEQSNRLHGSFPLPGKTPHGRKVSMALSEYGGSQRSSG